MVEPSVGEALNTNFKLAATEGWSDADGDALQYQFAYTRDRYIQCHIKEVLLLKALLVIVFYLLFVNIDHVLTICLSSAESLNFPPP